MHDSISEKLPAGTGPAAETLTSTRRPATSSTRRTPSRRRARAAAADSRSCSGSAMLALRGDVLQLRRGGIRSEVPQARVARHQPLLAQFAQPAGVAEQGPPV